MNKPLVVITGASSGIGAAMAKAFSQEGYSLGLLARRVEMMEDLQLPNAVCLPVDVTNIDEFDQALRIAEEKFGEVDCLINNAGFVKGGDFTEVGHANHLNTVQVNLQGVINGIELVLPGMRQRKTGTIINISSVADRHSRPHIASYAATKAAVKSLSESLRAANAQYGIRICNLAPAKVMTPLMIAANLNLNEQQIIQAEDLAKAALWMYQQPQTICVRDLVFAPTYYQP